MVGVLVGAAVRVPVEVLLDLLGWVCSFLTRVVGGVFVLAGVDLGVTGVEAEAEDVGGDAGVNVSGTLDVTTGKTALAVIISFVFRSPVTVVGFTVIIVTNKNAEIIGVRT